MVRGSARVGRRLAGFVAGVSSAGKKLGLSRSAGPGPEDGPVRHGCRTGSDRSLVWSEDRLVVHRFAHIVKDDRLAVVEIRDGAGDAEEACLEFGVHLVGAAEYSDCRSRAEAHEGRVAERGVWPPHAIWRVGALSGPRGGDPCTDGGGGFRRA